MPSQPGENLGKRLGESKSRSVRTQNAVEGFLLLENSYKLCQGFHQAMKAQTTCFISFIKLFSVLTKRKTIYKAHTVNSYNSETVNHIALIIVVLHSTVYENTLVDQSKPTYYPNYFIKQFKVFFAYSSKRKILIFI